MISSARRQAWAKGCRFCVATRLQGLCRAGVFARRLGFAASLGLRDDASIVPYGRGAGPCRGLQDTCGSRRQCTLPSAPCGASTSPCRGGFANGFHPKGSPARGAVGARRVSGTMQASSPTEAGQGTAGVCRIPVGQGGNAPLCLRLAAHPPSGLRCPHRAACAEARLCSATAAPAASRFLRRRRRSTPQPLAGEAFGGRLSRWVGSCRRLAGRCTHRPLRTRSKALPEFAGYPWGRAAMHPSVCALRRIHLPLQGRLCKRFSPKRLPCKGSCRRTAALGFRDDASIVPYGRGVRP